MNYKNVLKKHISKSAVLTTIVGAIVINEQVLLARLKREKEKFEAEKEILNKKISILEEKNRNSKDTSFRFYKVLRNNADYESFEKLCKDTFVYNDTNVFNKYRVDSLSKKLIEDYDSLSFVLDRKKSNKLLDEELEAFEKFKQSDSIPLILENGKIFLNSMLNIMKYHNRSVGNSLVRILDNSEETNDREFKARYLMFKVKGKNKMYKSKYDMTADYYRLIFIRNVSQYKRTARYINRIVDSLTNEYNIKRTNDSIAFEVNKNRKIDSLLNTPVKKELFSPYKFKNFNLKNIARDKFN